MAQNTVSLRDAACPRDKEFGGDHHHREYIERGQPREGTAF
jgi:hypothetical protein